MQNTSSLWPTKTRAEWQSEKAAIARHLISCKRKLVAQWGSRYHRVGLAEAEAELANVKAGRFRAPASFVEFEAHQARYASARLLGFAGGAQ